MKKRISFILLVIAVILITIIFTGCGPRYYNADLMQYWETYNQDHPAGKDYHVSYCGSEVACN